MQEAQIPTAKFNVVSSWPEVQKQIANHTAPYVLKADGLAAGKGVFICKDLGELESASRSLFEQKILGSAGDRALLEEFTPGWELSYIVLTNGEDFRALPFAQDHKRLLDNNCGPNTGGMGTIAPLEIDHDLRDKIDNQIVRPTLKLIQEKGIVFRGIIFFGLMITAAGPSLLEYNCRLGDPETQVLLPLLDGDWGQVFSEISKGKLPHLTFKNLATCCVILAAPGYPDQTQKGVPMIGDPNYETSSSYFIHAGCEKSPRGCQVCRHRNKARWQVPDCARVRCRSLPPIPVQGRRQRAAAPPPARVRPLPPKIRAEPARTAAKPDAAEAIAGIAGTSALG